MVTVPAELSDDPMGPGDVMIQGVTVVERPSGRFEVIGKRDLILKFTTGDRVKAEWYADGWNDAIDEVNSDAS